MNCPQHIPQKFDAADVDEAIQRLQDRIATLEAENKKLIEQTSKRGGVGKAGDPD